MFKSTGTLEYRNHFNLRLNIDPEIVRYYRNFVPKYFNIKPQAYAPHISVVRKESEVFTEGWGLYEGRVIPFEYDNEIHSDGIYFWLNAYSTSLELIRMGLGLTRQRWSRASHDYFKCFHITLGNLKTAIT